MDRWQVDRWGPGEGGLFPSWEPLEVGEGTGGPKQDPRESEWLCRTLEWWEQRTLRAPRAGDDCWALPMRPHSKAREPRS